MKVNDDRLDGSNGQCGKKLVIIVYMLEYMQLDRIHLVHLFLRFH